MIHTTKVACSLRAKACITAIGIVAMCAACHAQSVPLTTSKAKALSVPTFHCLSVYWSPEQGGAGKQVSMKFREAGHRTWRNGLPMRYNPVKTPECKADYRGSIVNLKPGTLYEVALQLNDTEIRTRFKAATWSERFPAPSVIPCESHNRTLNVTQSGTPQSYVLYDGTGCTIDTQNKDDVGIAVNASYVILRGFTIKNVKEHGIRLFKGHHIVIEDCDISQWGSESEQGWGKNYQAALFSNQRDLHTVVIQRCKLHHPTWDTNSWAQKHGKSTHPAGPQTVVFWESEGNHVIRYNECWSDKDHYFNDAMGAGSNGGFRGFPGADSDIYGNYIANCWDDGIEAEGGDQNVRVWNNYIEEVLIPIANAAVSIGPFYAWRNVSGRCYSPPGSSWDMTHGPFFKMGFAGGEQWMTGHMYLFNNTIFQANDEGASGIGGSSRIIKHCVTRNNVLHVRHSDSHSISKGKNVNNDFDYDLLSARHPEGQEKHGLSGKPTYAPGTGFNFKSKQGNFQLAPESPGYNQGVVIPNFCDVFTGNAPDTGAHEASTAPMEFGVKAQFIPPGAEKE
ncbi:MAG: right-handed parallel beta-helix repeat-containing protein [Phycisphaeraceae bacterium]|nr:right-handed parallel beta-helix repeat-containing protein [Phycisphaeraceae bacterium]